MDASLCVPYCTRTVSHHQKAKAAPPSAHGDTPKPRPYVDTVAKPPIGSRKGPVAGPSMSLGGLWSVDFDALRANCCTGSSPVVPLTLYQRVRARYEDSNEV